MLWSTVIAVTIAESIAVIATVAIADSIQIDTDT